MSKVTLKDHREIGRELDLFSFHQYAPGAIFWHPKGWLIYRTLVDFIRGKTDEENYLEISTPVMIKNQLFVESGHFEHFGENMFNLKVDKEDYSLKPMNCPESALIYKSKTRSYHDLPLRLSEFGILHRKELSGVLGGALRVRQFTIDDAHIFLRPDQVEAEIANLISLVQEIYKSLGFKTRFYLATRPDKAMGDKKSWHQAEKALEKALKQSKVSFDIKPKDGAFYGPKIDIHIYDSQDRDWQLATIQLDFQIPQSMKLEYADRDGSKKRPVMVHRGIFGSLERFIGILLEHTQGNLPVWLSPIQAIVLPVSDKSADFSQKITEKIRAGGIRVENDKRNETLQAKIRDALSQKFPYILVAGEKEQKSAKLSIRERNQKDLRQMKIEELITKIKTDIEKKLDWVEIAPEANPPVVKIIEFKKFKYLEDRKEKEARKHAKQTELKEVRFSPFIGKHDFDTGIEKVKKFIEEGNMVKITVVFKGRQMAHTEFGPKRLDEIMRELEGFAELDRPARFEGRRFATIIKPARGSKTNKEQPDEDKN